MQIYNDGELTKEATIKKYLIVQNEGNRQVNRDIARWHIWTAKLSLQLNLLVI